jgi:KDO2-lipid IV(A) lauroyltransferase
VVTIDEITVDVAPGDERTGWSTARCGSTTMAYWYHLIGSFLVGALPRPVAYALVALLAPPVSRVWTRQHAWAVRNMEWVLGPGRRRIDVERRVREVFRNYARYLIDVLRLQHLDDSEVERRFRAYGLEHIEEGLSHGRGVVLVTAHVGNWDMAGAFLSGRGFPVNVLVETLEPKRWNDRVQGIREAIGMRAIPVESGVRSMLQALRRNEILAVLIDRPLTCEGVPVRFFDRETRVPGGAATLALRSGARLVAATTVRAGDGYVAHISPLLDFERSGNAERDVQALTQRVMSWLELQIRRYPEQWFMFRNMWPEAAR